MAVTVRDSTKGVSTDRAILCRAPALVAPFLSQSLTVPALSALGQVVVPLELLDQAHVDHTLEHPEQSVVRGVSDVLQLLEAELSLPLQVLGHLELSDGSRFAACDDVTAIRTEQVSLQVITSDFLATTYGTYRLCKSQCSSVRHNEDHATPLGIAHKPSEWAALFPRRATPLRRAGGRTSRSRSRTAHVRPALHSRRSDRIPRNPCSPARASPPSAP